MFTLNRLDNIIENQKKITWPKLNGIMYSNKKLTQ